VLFDLFVIPPLKSWVKEVTLFIPFESKKLQIIVEFFDTDALVRVFWKDNGGKLI